MPITRRHLAGLEGVFGGDEGGGEEARVGGESCEEGSCEARAGWGEIVPPVVKELACGVYGNGAMAEWTDIVRLIEGRFGLRDDRLVKRSEPVPDWEVLNDKSLV